MKKFYLAAALVALSTNLIAEDNIAVNKLEDSVITSENFETRILDTAKDVTVITAEEIQAKGANSIEEALKGTPGLKISHLDGGTAIFDLRGFGATGASNTKVLLDGVPLNSINNGEYNTAQIPVSIIDKIEVIPSAGSVMYGAGAVGGVINIITKTPQAKENYGHVNIEAGSWESKNVNVAYGTKATDNLLLNVAYSGAKTDGYRHSTMDKYDHPDRDSSVMANAKYLLKDGSVEAGYRHSSSRDYYTSYLTQKQYDENPKQENPTSGGRVRVREDNYILKYNQKLNENLDFMIYAGNDEIKYRGASWARYDVFQRYVKPQVKYTYAENSYVILGGDYENGKVETIGTPKQIKRKKAKAGYILNKTTVGDFQFTQGIRHEKTELTIPDKDKNKFDKNAWDLAVNYLYSDTGSVYASYNHGYRYPSIQDLNYWYGEPQEQKTNTYEIGLKDYYKNTYISTSIFRIDSDKEVIYDNSNSDSNKQKNKNFDGKIERLGAQVSLEHNLDKLVLRENVTYVDAEITSGDYKDKKFPGVPKWNINLGATYNFDENLALNLDMYYNSKTYNDDDFKNLYGEVNSYTTFDINANYKVYEGFNVYAGVKNLFDEKYSTATLGQKDRVYYPANGRKYYAGIRYTF